MSKIEDLTLSTFRGITRLDLLAQTHCQLTSLDLFQLHSLDRFPEGLAAHSKLQRLDLDLSGLSINLADFLEPCTHSRAPLLPKLLHLHVIGAIAPTFPAAITQGSSRYERGFGFVGSENRNEKFRSGEGLSAFRPTKTGTNLAKPSNRLQTISKTCAKVR